MNEPVAPTSPSPEQIRALLARVQAHAVDGVIALPRTGKGGLVPREDILSRRYDERQVQLVGASGYVLHTLLRAFAPPGQPGRIAMFEAMGMSHSVADRYYNKAGCVNLGPSVGEMAAAAFAQGDAVLEQELRQQFAMPVIHASQFVRRYPDRRERLTQKTPTSQNQGWEL